MRIDPDVIEASRPDDREIALLAAEVRRLQAVINSEEPALTDNEIAWATYQACNYAFMQYLSEPLRRGEQHCVSPTHVYLPKHFEDALNVAIAAFKPNEPTMRGGNKLFGSATVVFDADEFKFEQRNAETPSLALTDEERAAIEWAAGLSDKRPSGCRTTLRALLERLK
jgi:hypothetical protein